MPDNIFSTLMFYFLSFASIILALFVVNTKHIFRAAIYLMAVLVTSAGFYLLLGAEFLAGIQILVYVGGIVVLIVFAVMLTTSLQTPEVKPRISRQVIGGISSITFLVIMIMVVLSQEFPKPQAFSGSSEDIATLGKLLLDSGSKGYVLPFEIISILLLATIIGGIVVARKKPQEKE